MKDKPQFNSMEFDEFLDSTHYVIPLIYKDYGRMRGQIASVIAFERFFEGFHEKDQYLSHKCLRVEVDEIKELYKNKKFRDKILFSFNFIQDIEARGMYPLIARKHDICFSKGNVKGKYKYEFANEYAQTRPYSLNKGMKYFPKFFNFTKKRENKEVEQSFNRLISKSKDITIGIYYRKDTCPVQAKIYDEIRFHNQHKVKFKIYGSEHDENLEDKKLDVDVFLYVHPNHRDPFPNMIFDALCNSIPILVINNTNVNKEFTNGSGIEMLSHLFPTMFMFNDYHNLRSIPLSLLKYRFWKKNNILDVIEWNTITSRNLISQTTSAILDHINYSTLIRNQEREYAKMGTLIIPNVSFNEQANQLERK